MHNAVQPTTNEHITSVKVYKPILAAGIRDSGAWGLSPLNFFAFHCRFITSMLNLCRFLADETTF